MVFQNLWWTSQSLWITFWSKERFYLVRCFPNLFFGKGIIKEGSTHLTEVPSHRTSEDSCTSVVSTSEMGCGLFLLCHSHVGTVTAMHVSDVVGAHLQSCVTRGINLMVLGTWVWLNGRFTSETSLRISKFICFTLKPLKQFLTLISVFTTLWILFLGRT